MNIRIYVLCYNEETKRKALEEYGNKKQYKVLYIETTSLLENIMYDKWFLENYDEWKNFDYVGTISWKASTKIIMPIIERLENILETTKYDVFPFYRTNHNLIEQATNWHPKFKTIWLQLFNILDISEDIALDADIPSFFCNYWITTPKLMLEYITFFKKVKHIFDTENELQNNLWSDPKYSANTVSSEKCMEMYKKPYIPYHIFLYERIPCFFFWYNKNKIINPLDINLYYYLYI
jgi:hypothetical protein